MKTFARFKALSSTNKMLALFGVIMMLTSIYNWVDTDFSPTMFQLALVSAIPNILLIRKVLYN